MGELMSKHYIRFLANSERIKPEHCTTDWSADVTCSIIATAIEDGTAVLFMVIQGPDESIQSWLDENPGKVVELSREEFENLGSSLLPAGVEQNDWQYDGTSWVEVTYVRGEFDADSGSPWTEKE